MMIVYRNVINSLLLIPYIGGKKTFNTITANGDKLFCT